MLTFTAQTSALVLRVPESAASLLPKSSPPASRPDDCAHSIAGEEAEKCSDRDRAVHAQDTDPAARFPSGETGEGGGLKMYRRKEDTPHAQDVAYRDYCRDRCSGYCYWGVLSFGGCEWVIGLVKAVG